MWPGPQTRLTRGDGSNAVGTLVGQNASIFFFVWERAHTGIMLHARRATTHFLASSRVRFILTGSGVGGAPPAAQSVLDSGICSKTAGGAVSLFGVPDSLQNWELGSRMATHSLEHSAEEDADCALNEKKHYTETVMKQWETYRTGLDTTGEDLLAACTHPPLPTHPHLPPHIHMCVCVCVCVCGREGCVCGCRARNMP